MPSQGAVWAWYGRSAYCPDADLSTRWRVWVVRIRNQRGPSWFESNLTSPWDGSTRYRLAGLTHVFTEVHANVMSRGGQQDAQRTTFADWLLRRMSALGGIFAESWVVTRASSLDASPLQVW